MVALRDWKLLYYQTASGRMPFWEWRQGLMDKRVRLAVLRRLERLGAGLFGDCAPVGEGVFEFRIDMGPGYRGYYFRAGRSIIVLLCGGDKSTQVEDIETAKSYRRDYEQRTLPTRGSG